MNRFVPPFSLIFFFSFLFFSFQIVKAEEDYLASARKSLAEGKYEKTIRLCEKAQSKGYFLWDLRALIQEARLGIKRNEGRVIDILYTGPLNGYIFSVNGGLGGLPRITTWVEKMRAKYPGAFYLECGNYLRKKKATRLNTSMGSPFLKSLNLIWFVWDLRKYFREKIP